jgi:orc1/cdc6 family replication initiation protein
MITDARVLQPEFVPSEVQHRDAEVNHLSAALRPLIEGDPTDPVLIDGPPGVGKTCIARFTVERLREASVELNHQYVNCWEEYSRFKTLYEVLDGVGDTIDIHRQSTPTDVLLDRLRDYDGPPYIIILDEVDQLEDKSLLYDLYRIPDLTMVLIANDENQLFAGLDDRLNSRLSACTRVHFETYASDELTTILHDRVRWGLNADYLQDGVLETIAELAAGDARTAIGILRQAAHTVYTESLDTLSESVAHDVAPAARSEIRSKAVDRLTNHQEVLYNIITDHGQVAPRDLYEAYRERIEDPKTKRTIRNYLAKLEQYNLIAADGQTKGRRYRALTDATPT